MVLRNHRATPRIQTWGPRENVHVAAWADVRHKAEHGHLGYAGHPARRVNRVALNQRRDNCGTFLCDKPIHSKQFMLERLRI